MRKNYHTLNKEKKVYTNGKNKSTDDELVQFLFNSSIDDKLEIKDNEEINNKIRNMLFKNIKIKNRRNHSAETRRNKH